MVLPEFRAFRSGGKREVPFERRTVNAPHAGWTLPATGCAVNALKCGVRADFATSVSRRYYVGIVSVEGSVFRDARQVGGVGVKGG